MSVVDLGCKKKTQILVCYFLRTKSTTFAIMGLRERKHSNGDGPPIKDAGHLNGQEPFGPNEYRT